MKVVHVAAVDVTASVLLRAQLLALRDAGYEVHTATSPGPTLDRLRREGIRCHELPVERSMNVRALARTTSRMLRLFRSESFDVVHTHTPVASVAARLAARLAGTPHVFYTAHGFYFHDNMQPVVRAVHVGLERWLGRMTEHLFCQSEEDTAAAIRHGIAREGSVTTLGNGIDIRSFQSAEVASAEARRQTRERYGIPADATVVGFVGRLVAEKGVRELLTAMESVAERAPDIVLVVVGSRLRSDRVTRQEHGLDELLRQRERAHRVIFTGHVDGCEAIVNAFDVFVLPSYREGMPRSILEAMAASKPVVATNIRGCREEVVAGETGLLVPVQDAASLADALCTLALNPRLRERYGEAGRRRVEAVFDERLVCTRLLEKYADVLSCEPVRVARSAGACRVTPRPETEAVD